MPISIYSHNIKVTKWLLDQDIQDTLNFLNAVFEELLIKTGEDKIKADITPKQTTSCYYF
jgi:hypothetical protein